MAHPVLSAPVLPARKTLVFEDTGALAYYFLAQCEDIAARAIRERGRCALALSGGRTPAPLYDAMARSTLPWEKMHIFQADERFVARGDPRSNYRLLREHLLEPAGIPAARVHAVPVTGSPREAAAVYEAELRRFFRGTPRFDCVLLGVGEDGHTASLFPGAAALVDAHFVAAVEHEPLPRVTLTLAALNRARAVFFMVTGRGKAAVVKDVLEKGDARLPAARVRPESGGPVFLLDGAAASRLAGREVEETITFCNEL